MFSDELQHNNLFPENLSFNDNDCILNLNSEFINDSLCNFNAESQFYKTSFHNYVIESDINKETNSMFLERKRENLILDNDYKSGNNDLWEISLSLNAYKNNDKILSSNKIDEDTLDQSRRVSQCTSSSSFLFIDFDEKERNTVKINNQQRDYISPEWIGERRKEIKEHFIFNNTKISKSKHKTQINHSKVRTDELSPKKDSPISNKKCGNPINKLLKLIKDENINISNEKDQFLKLINSSTVVVPENKKKMLFLSKKLSDCTMINNSQKKEIKKNCCSCKKSSCLKLYCECFKNQDYCESCTCPNCLNKESFEVIRQQSITHLKHKSKHAFKSIIVEDKNNLEEGAKKHIKGCKCKNSNCKKNYCECYQYGLKCTSSCKCNNCENCSNCTN